MNFNTLLYAQCYDNTCECVYSLALQEDTLWIGTKVGLFKYNIKNGNKQLYDKTNSPLPNNFVNAIKVDTDQSLWIGTYGGGLVHLKNNQWSTFSTNNSQISSNNIFGIEKFQDKLWLGTEKGVATYDGTTFKVYNQTNSLLPSSVVFSFANEGDSVMWVAVSGGLYKYNGNWTSYTRENSGLPHNIVYNVAVKEQLKYVSTMGGIVCFDGNTWTLKSYDYTLVLKFDPNSNEYWAGTATSGLNHFLNDSYGGFETYNTSNSIMTNNNVQALIVDNNSTVWIGTWGGGAYKLVPGYFTKLNLDVTEGINENIIASDISIYPNPIEDYVDIDCTSFPLEALQKVEIYNLNGQLLKTKKDKVSENRIRIATDNLKSGIYLLKIYFEGKNIIEKIIKK